MCQRKTRAEKKKFFFEKFRLGLWCFRNWFMSTPPRTQSQPSGTQASATGTGARSSGKMCKKEKISINRNSADARCFALICDCISRLHYPGDKRYTKRYCCHIQWAVENYYHLSESPPLTPKPNFSFEEAQYKSEHPKIKLYTVGNFKAPQKGVLFSSSAHVFFAFHFDIVGRHGIPKCIP